MYIALLSGSPILDVDATFLIYVAVFFVLLFVLKTFVFRPMMDLFDAREAAIGGAKADAKALTEKAENMLAAFEEEMAKVRKEANVERERLRADGQSLDRKLTEKVRKETEKLVAEADAEMSAAAKKARKQIASQSSMLAKDIAEKMLGRGVKQ